MSRHELIDVRTHWALLRCASPGVALGDHTKVTSAVYGTGIAKGYVEECTSTNTPPEGHTCYRVYLVLDAKVALNVYARKQPARLPSFQQRP